MWAFMDQSEAVWVKSNKEGVAKVIKEDGKYAFMMESTVVDYVVERECQLTQVGGLLDNKGYGIGLPPSEYCSLFFTIFSKKLLIIPLNRVFARRQK